MGACRWLLRLSCAACASALPPFVVLSLARSGTTWLMSLLNDHPRIRAQSEILLKSRSAAESSHVLAALEASVLKSPRKAVGFKFFEGQGAESLGAGGGGASGGAIGGWLRSQGARVVVLERQGLARFVSQIKHKQAIRNFARLEAGGQIASASEKFKCSEADCVDRARARMITLNATTVVQRLEAQFHEWDEILAWTRKYVFADVQYHTYRDLVADTACEMGRIFSFLGVGAHAANATTTLKMGGPTPRDDLRNADEVAAALVGSRWEGEVDRGGA